MTAYETHTRSCRRRNGRWPWLSQTGGRPIEVEGLGAIHDELAQIRQRMFVLQQKLYDAADGR